MIFQHKDRYLFSAGHKPEDMRRSCCMIIFRFDQIRPEGARSNLNDIFVLLPKADGNSLSSLYLSSLRK